MSLSVNGRRTERPHAGRRPGGCSAHTPFARLPVRAGAAQGVLPAAGAHQAKQGAACRTPTCQPGLRTSEVLTLGGTCMGLTAPPPPGNTDFVRASCSPRGRREHPYPLCMGVQATSEPRWAELSPRGPGPTQSLCGSFPLTMTRIEDSGLLLCLGLYVTWTV